MLIKTVLLAVILLVAVATANKNICTFQYECGANSYCHGGYCVDCISNNDCGLNQFCNLVNTIDLNKYGSCQDFPYDNAKCIVLGTTDLADERVDNSTKCAVQYYDSNLAVGSRMVTEFQGTCTNGRCRQCLYNNDGSSQQGKGSQRTCVFPGKYATIHSAEWAPGRYYESPIHVWLAILFCLTAIITIFHFLGFLFHK
ncbi:hypothetical protein SAMD00019534_119530 [Acytostelium subglobosum LB1]|uniref:hypothetical protein n=1 Tax=Acytostelium subglobosum LB1 TaxID=1410327 RepID=UPI00064497A6|nr:hypothetical protein SAMD00019534_119530 [Acytostelium subglobosum LB1]GAM28777.1 hypothetical protein SAMD00019534_119530 [Acytostelium subglobosum LB1]|eukprot:XP_012748332.1 hypothetical protein SAMD00019534_119530 [Acytostelium subglobosum LB1]